MGEMGKELATFARREIADDQGSAGPLVRDRRSGALDTRDETREAVMAFVVPEPAVAFSFARQLGRLGQHPAVRHADRPAELRGEGRRRARAPGRRERQRGDGDEAEARSHEDVLPENARISELSPIAQLSLVRRSQSSKQ
jgi:hypothetical protein